MDPIILYGAPHSLYTGKTRSYLRKQGIAYVERAPDAHFRDVIVPATGRVIIPVVALPDGTILQDTVDILDHFERRGARVSAYPAGPRQRVLAHITELHAAVALTRHAMHYRWSYAGEQTRFLHDAFARGSGDADAVMARMASYLPMLGVTTDTVPAIEESYLALLDLLEAHFAAQPYLFGGQPSLGDYGLLGPLFAHLGRDPVPADIMKRRAPKVFRWVERMNAPDADMPEFADAAPAFLPDDALAPTLAPLFRHMAAELFPELTDAAAMMTRHVAAADPQEGAPVTDKPHRRVIGSVATHFRGVPVQGGVQPYTFYLWQRVTDAFDALDADAAASVRGWLDEVGLAPLLDTPRPIRVERRDLIEVWGRRL